MSEASSKVNSFTEMIKRIIKSLDDLAKNIKSYSESIIEVNRNLTDSDIPCGNLFYLSYIIKDIDDVSLALDKCKYGCNRTGTIEFAGVLQRLSKRLTAVLAYWHNNDYMHRFYIQLLDRCNIQMIYHDFVNNILTNGYKTKTYVMLPMQQLHIDYSSSENRFIVSGCKIDIEQCWKDVIKLLHNDAYTYLTDDINDRHDIVSVDNRTFVAYCKNGTNTLDMSVHQGSVNVIESTPTDIVKESLILLIIACYCNYAVGSININIDKAYINKDDSKVGSLHSSKVDSLHSSKVNIPDNVVLSDQQVMTVWYTDNTTPYIRSNIKDLLHSSKVNHKEYITNETKTTTFLQFIDILSYILRTADE